MSVHKYGDTVYDWENGVVYNVKHHSESYRYRTFEEAKVSKNGKGVVLDGIFHFLEDTFPMTQVTRELEKSKKYHELQIDRLYWEERLAEVNRRLKDVNKAIGEQVKEAVSLVPAGLVRQLVFHEDGLSFLVSHVAFLPATDAPPLEPPLVIRPGVTLWHGTPSPLFPIGTLARSRHGNRPCTST